MQKGMARHGLTLILCLGLALSVAAVGKHKGHKERRVDCSTETDTDYIIIKWHKRPVDVQHFFLEHDYDLHWIVDFDEDYSVYKGPDKHEASACMRSILSYINEDVEGYGYGGFDAHKREVLQHYVDNVFGEGTGKIGASQPAAVASECNSGQPNACPADGLYGLNMIKAPQVWNALPGVVNQDPTEAVMVIDTGVRGTHRDLEPNLVPGASITFKNIIPEPSDYERDPDGGDHGTHVSGTVFGAWNNGDESAVGVVGRAQGISCNCGMTFPDGCVIQCIRHAMANSVRVINMSFGGGRGTRYEEDHPLRVYFERFCEYGGLIIPAAGNDNRDLSDGVDFDYPTLFAEDLAEDYPKCILNVANVDDKQRIAPSSNYDATWVKVAAPGTDILSSITDSDTAVGKKSGTSMAAPHVSGMATLLFNAFPGSAAERVYDCIVTTATRTPKPHPDEPKDKPLGGGIVDLKAAYECMDDKPKCPKTGLPACVLKNTGMAVETCDTKRYCKPLNNDFVCQYAYAPDNTLCKHKEKDGHGLFAAVSEAELAAVGISSNATSAAVMGSRLRKNKLHTCGACQAGKCVTESRSWCKKAKRRSQQKTRTEQEAPTKQEV